jgi:hypothetical protein
MDDLNTARQNGAEVPERSEKLPATSGKLGQKIYGRDALTNGTKTLPDTDGRLRIARREHKVSTSLILLMLQCRKAMNLLGHSSSQGYRMPSPQFLLARRYFGTLLVRAGF